MEVKEMLDREEEMVREMLKKHDHIITHIVIEKTVNGQDILIPIFISAEREHIKMTIEALAKQKPNYLIVVTEGYMKRVDKIENYPHGTLEKEFKKGSKDVLDVIILQAYPSMGS
jgi:ABC-type Fe3+-citrate transport system substrate-binding protein